MFFHPVDFAFLGFLAISVAVITLFWGGCAHLNKTTGLSSLSILNICKQRLDVIFSRRMFSLFWGWSRRWGCSCNKVFDFRCRSCNSFLLIFLLSKALKMIGSFYPFPFPFGDAPFMSWSSDCIQVDHVWLIKTWFQGGNWDFNFRLFWCRMSTMQWCWILGLV